MSILMVGVDESTKGGMWTVIENYMCNKDFVKKNDLIYIPTAITGCPIPRRLLFTFKSYMKIIRVFNRKQINLIHVHMSERASIWRKRIVIDYAKRHGAKIVLHLHGAEFEVLYKQMSERKKRFVRETLDAADRIIILGEYWKEFIGSLADHPEKIRVVYNAVKIPEQYCYNSESNTILFLGAVSKRKGIEILIKSLQKTADILKSKVQVKIYGPDVIGNIKDIITEAGLQEWVNYCGWLDKDDKPAILKNTAVNVLPSYNEGLPMTILEAMSYGIPSITTDIAAIPEAVNKTNGILVKPGNIAQLSKALINIVADKNYRIYLSKKSYDDALNKFSVQTHINIIQSIYEEFQL